MSYKQVEGSNELFRDTESGAILNTSRSAYIAYKNRREQKLREMERIDKLEDDVGEIKSLLNKIIDKL
tara:strand:+ start:7503 stop:7706 length:204 start_codon:yes stop_codon:yes gene_type:complete